MTPRRSRPAWWVVLAVAVALSVPVVVHIAGTAHRPVRRAAALAASPPVIAWVDDPAPVPDPPTSPPAPRTRPCTAADTAAVTHWGNDGAGGHQFVILAVRNVGRSPCTMSGRPALWSTSTRGRVSRIPTTMLDVAYRADGYATIASGESARVTVETLTMSPCGTYTNGWAYPGVSVEVAGRRLAVTPAYALTTSCPPPLRVSDWYVDGSAPAATPPPDPYAAVTVTLSAPASVAPGTAVHYTVTLSNPGAAVPMTPCPVYVEELGKTRLTYRLNCAGGVLPPGDTRFAMTLALPDWAPAGAYQLDWQLAAPDPVTGPQASIAVTVI